MQCRTNLRALNGDETRRNNDETRRNNDETRRNNDETRRNNSIFMILIRDNEFETKGIKF